MPATFTAKGWKLSYLIKCIQPIHFGYQKVDQNICDSQKRMEIVNNHIG